MSFPEKFIKGIPNEEFIATDGTVGAHLFYFSPPKTSRDDNKHETSINWQDDSDAINFTLNQKKENGEFQFKVGVAIIPLKEVNRLNELPMVNNLLSYERSPNPDNKYHGNLLVPSNIHKHTMRRLAAGIANVVLNYIYR